MLKRIAVVGVSKAALKDLQSAVADQPVQLLAAAADKALPPGVAAVLAAPRSADAGLSAALAAAAQQEQLLLLLAAAVDARLGLVPGTSERVRDHARRMAVAMGLDEDETFLLERAGLMRDIGTLELSNELLLKKDVLTYDEWVNIRRHPAIGADLLATVDFLRDTAPVVRHHHETFDGLGYPDAIEGEAIPRLARALHIVDVFCAMTSDRPYREGKAALEEALDFLRNESGKHFDPELVSVFVDGSVGSDSAAEA